MVVLFHRDLLPDVLLGDAQFLFNAKLHRQTMSIPTSLAIHPKTFLCTVAAEDVLDGARHHVVDPGQAVRARRAFVKDEVWRVLPQFEALSKGVLRLPLLQDLIGQPRKIEFVVLGKTLGHGFGKGPQR